MPTVDYDTDMTEYDPQGRLTVGDTTIAISGLGEDEKAYVYKAYGAGYWDDFVVQTSFRVNSSSGDWYGWTCPFWSDYIETKKKQHDDGRDSIFLYVRHSTGTAIQVGLIECDAGTDYADYWNGGAEDTWYYVTIEKNGTAFSCKIFSDAARQNLLDTLNLTLHSDYAFNYMYGFNASNEGWVTYDASGDVGPLHILVSQATPETFGMDAILQKVATPSTFAADLQVLKQLTATLGLDVALKIIGVEVPFAFDMEAMKVAIEQSLGADILIQAAGLESDFAFDLQLMGTLQSGFGIDVKLNAQFRIISKSVDPVKVIRIGAYQTELRVDFHDEFDKAVGDYLVWFFLREPNDSTIHGPYVGSNTKEGSKEYNSVYDWNPDDGLPTGTYDLRAKVFKREML